MGRGLRGAGVLVAFTLAGGAPGAEAAASVSRTEAAASAPPAAGTTPQESAPPRPAPQEAAREAERPAPQEALVTDAVTVTTTWLGPPTEASVRGFAGTRTVLDEEALSGAGARVLEDALRTVPGVRVQDESGTGLLPNIGVRGLSPSRSEQVLVLVDGIPVSPAPYGQTGLSLFPVTLQTLAAVDVARGGIAVHYGPNNVGGVINLVTKPIPTALHASGRLGVFLGARSTAMSDVYARAGGFVSERLGLQLQANGLSGDAARVHSRTRALNVIGDAEWLPGDATSVKAKLQYYQARADLPGALTPEAYAEDRTASQRPLDAFDGQVLRGSASVTQEVGAGELTLTTFGHQGRRLFAFAVPLSAGAQPQRLSTSPRGYRVLGSELRHTLPLEGPVSHRLTWGARYVSEQVDYIVDSRELATDAYRVTRSWWFRTNAGAAYVSDTLSLLEGRLKVTPGLRAELVQLRHRDRLTAAENRNVTHDLLPGLSVGYQAARPLFLYGNYHRSFRPVQFTQITFGNTLVSERAQNFELGLRSTPLPGLELGVAAFHIRFQDKLEFVSQAVGYRNLGKAWHTGAEGTLALQPLAGLDLRLGYTLLAATQRSGPLAGRALPYASPHEGTFRVSYRRGATGGGLNGSCRSDAFSDAENTAGESADGARGLVPGGCVANVEVSHALRLEAGTVQLGLGVNNVLDAQLFTRNVDYSLGRVPAPGRSVLLTLGFER